MCSIVLLRRPRHRWPLLVAANRDEMRDRPWDPPARHWPERPEVLAGRDRLSGGSWLGLNEHGVLAAVLNRVGSLGPSPDKRSRGELVLDALDHTDAASAAEQLRHLDAGAYRSFNLVVADIENAYWLAGREERRKVEMEAVPDGLSMLTAREMNDTDSPRIAQFLPEFHETLAPDPDIDDWEAWRELLRRRDPVAPTSGMTIVTEEGFETVSSSLIALPASQHYLAGERASPIWLFAAGRPDETEYLPVSLDADAT